MAWYVLYGVCCGVCAGCVQVVCRWCASGVQVVCRWCVWVRVPGGGGVHACGSKYLGAMFKRDTSSTLTSFTLTYFTDILHLPSTLTQHTYYAS